jgi:hypothetical protein
MSSTRKSFERDLNVSDEFRIMKTDFDRLKEENGFLRADLHAIRVLLYSETQALRVENEARHRALNSYRDQNQVLFDRMELLESSIKMRTR